MSKLQEISYTNDIGQIINPGDTVIGIATGYSHRVTVYHGVFVGVTNGNPSVIVDATKFGWWDGDKQVGYSKGSALKIKPTTRKIKRRTTFKLGRVYKLA